jgi:hypothetical protein
MNVENWVQHLGLHSSIAEIGVLLTGRDGALPTRAVGSGVFVAPRLIMTVKHVVREFWRLFEDQDVGELEELKKKVPAFELFAVQCPGISGTMALWAASKITFCPYSDLAVISVVPVDDPAKAYAFRTLPRLNVLPPARGTKVTAFGYWDTSVQTEIGNQITFQLQPRVAWGTVTDVYPVSRDTVLLPFPSFEIEARFYGGMSGGPIFNEAGEVCGLICSGYDDVPVASGVVLWPMLGIPIKHVGPGVVGTGKFPMFLLAKAGLMHVTGWDLVDGNVEEFVDSKGKRRVRLKVGN